VLVLELLHLGRIQFLRDGGDGGILADAETTPWMMPTALDLPRRLGPDGRHSSLVARRWWGKVQQAGEYFGYERLQRHDAGNGNGDIGLDAGPEGDRDVVVRVIGSIFGHDQINQSDDGDETNASTTCQASWQINIERRLIPCCRARKRHLQEAKGKEDEEHYLLPYRKPQSEDNWHWEAEY
jgi:hypothetical protein